MVIKCICCRNEFENENLLNKKFSMCPYCGRRINDNENIELILKMKYHKNADELGYLPPPSPINININNNEQKNTVSIYRVTQDFTDQFGNINKNVHFEQYYTVEDPKSYNNFYINENYEFDFKLCINEFGLQGIKEINDTKNICINKDIIYSNMLSISVNIVNQKQNDYYMNYFTFDFSMLNDLIDNLRKYDKVLKFDLDQIYLFTNSLNTLVNSIEKDFPPEYLASLGG